MVEFDTTRETLPPLDSKFYTGAAWLSADCNLSSRVNSLNNRNTPVLNPLGCILYATTYERKREKHRRRAKKEKA